MLPLVSLPTGWTVVANVAAAVVFHALPGWHVHRLARRRLERDGPLLRLRHWDRERRAYERLGIRRWKDLLPEAGALFAGGVSKRHLLGRSPEALERFVIETRRAERGHWLSLACFPLAVLWNPPAGAAAMTVYGVVVNAPFIAIQRYNRGRLLALIERSTSPGGR